jgi:hypothetical protein
MFPKFDDLARDFYYTTACENRYREWLYVIECKYPDVEVQWCKPSKPYTTYIFRDHSQLIVNERGSRTPKVVGVTNK